MPLHRVIFSASLALLLATLAAYAETPAELKARAQAKAVAARQQFAAVAQTRGLEWKIDSAPAQQIEGTLSTTIDTPDLTAREWLLFAPLPKDGPAQRNVKWSTRLPARIARELGGPGREMLLARLAATPATTHTITSDFTYSAELLSRRLVPSRPGGPPAATAPKPPALDPREAQLYLARTDLVDFDHPAFQAYLDKSDLRPRKNESDIQFARRAFLAIANSAAYEYTSRMDRHASKTCDAKKTDCGGLSIWYCATLRAGGIPSRQLVGRWAQSARDDQTMGQVADYKQEHVKAEFFALGVGWIPVDLTAAVNTKLELLRPLHFGNDPGDFLTLHYDTDFTVDTVYLGPQHIALLQNIAFWATGAGTTNNHTAKIQWQVKRAEPSPQKLLPAAK